MNIIATAKGAVEIRELRSITEMIQAEALQGLVWGLETIPHPKEILIPVQYEGGLLAGAFHQDEMIGLIFGFPTRDPSIQHSQLLATREDWRRLGIGAALKWYQRAWCLERSIRLVRWTVDPLRIANANLNIHILGGTSSTYFSDFYGVMQGIDAGAPTDRLLIEWQIDSSRVAERFANPTECSTYSLLPSANDIEDEKPVRIRLDLDDPEFLVRLPDNFGLLTRTNPELALVWRLETRKLFQTYFQNGYAISGFLISNGPAYVMERQSS